MADFSRHIEKFECLLPFWEDDVLSMRSVELQIVVNSDASDGSGTAAEMDEIISKLKEGKEKKSLEEAFGLEEATFESLVNAIYGMLSNPACVWISDGGRSAYRGDPAALFPQPSGGGGGSGSGVNVDAVRETLVSYASADEPNTQHGLWESVKNLASDVAVDLGYVEESSQQEVLK